MLPSGRNAIPWGSLWRLKVLFVNRLTHCCSLVSDALPPREVVETTADTMRFVPARFVEPGMALAARQGAGTDNTLFSGV